jgi:hypothetical protein
MGSYVDTMDWVKERNRIQTGGVVEAYWRRGGGVV